MLVLHYTGMASHDGALGWLTNPDSGVSAHYLVDRNGAVTQMVSEHRRAWHAGLSSWAGNTDINSCSVGIEIHNPGHDAGYPDYPAGQLRAVIALCRDIVLRNGIAAARVLAHSDVAPARKDDPGEKFDWAWLHREGVGLWVPATAPLGDGGLGPGDTGPEVSALRQELADFGYGLPITATYDESLRQVVTAFQRHWRQRRVDGRADRSTIATLRALRALAAQA